MNALEFLTDIICQRILIGHRFVWAIISQSGDDMFGYLNIIRIDPIQIFYFAVFAAVENCDPAWTAAIKPLLERLQVIGNHLSHTTGEEMIVKKNNLHAETHWIAEVAKDLKNSMQSTLCGKIL